MSKVICPGQDTRFWRPEDIFDVECPQCAGTIEFMKDEATRKCKACKLTVRNPKIDTGCAQYCDYAEKCLGVIESPSAD